MNNTEKSFKDKWENNKNLAFEETLREGSEIFNWILNRNGFKNRESFQNFLKEKKRILDAGCGNGRVTALLRLNCSPDKTEIVGIDLVAAEVAKKNLSTESNVTFFQKDLLGDLSDLGKFDFIYCQEVLHHTNDPRRAFKNLVSLLGDNGEIAIYVYKRKAPVREYVDDYIRNIISKYDYEKAMEVCSEITQLGKSLHESKLQIKVPKLDILEIDGGEFDIQRFIYHFFMKCFWNPDLSFEANVAINYDWYHPQNCTRHTLEEIKNWFEESNLTINHAFQDYYGITIKGQIK